MIVIASNVLIVYNFLLAKAGSDPEIRGRVVIGWEVIIMKYMDKVKRITLYNERRVCDVIRTTT